MIHVPHGQPPERVLLSYDDDLLVFIDETGHEQLSHGNGLFGLGGIIVYGADYNRNVVQPWGAIRSQMNFPGDEPLHAAADRLRYFPHLELLANFFLTGIFVRHAAIVTSATVTNADPFVATACGGLFRNMGRALGRVCKSSPIGRILFVLEHSERLKSAYQKLCGPSGPTLIDARGGRREFPHLWATLPKSACEPGLEVADFVLHAAQGQVRTKLRNSNAPFRKDFDCVFRKVHPEHVEYMEINRIEATPADGPRGLFRIGLL
jgi:hypothetical protein